MNGENKIQELQPLLREACERIRRLLAQADLGDSCARYEVGAIIARLKADPDTYGANAVARLESELARGKSSLYRYGQVAECWDEGAFLGLLERKSRSGLPLSWRHFEVLAAAEAKTREALIEAALERDLTAYHLEQAIRQGKREQVAASLPPGVSPVREIIRQIAAHARGLAGDAAHWEREIAPVLPMLSPEAAWQLLAVTERAREQCVLAAAAATQLAARLQQFAEAGAANTTAEDQRRRVG